MRAPAAIVAVPLLTGVAAGILLFDRLPAGIATIAAAASVLAWLAAAGAVLDECPPEATVLAAVTSVLCGLSLGVTNAQEVYQPPLLAWFDAQPQAEAVIVHGTLREDAARTPFGASMSMGVTSVETPGGVPVVASRARQSGGVRLSVGGALGPDGAREWRAGRRIRTAALLRRPAAYRDPGVPDDGRALARRGIALVGSVKSGALVEIAARGSRLEEAAAAARAWSRERLAVAIAPFAPRSAAIATAVLIGDRSALSEEDERRLQEAGTYHVIAISGGNVAILTVLIVGALRLLFVPPRAAAAIAVLLLLFYGQIAGGAASVGRAIAVAVLFLSARMLDHRGPGLNAIAVAAALGVAAVPVVALDPGFILSFGATLGILLGLPGRRLGAAAALAVGTICAELALLPVAAALFGRITFAGLLLNFVAIPLMTAVQIGGALVLVSSTCSRVAMEWAAYGTHLAADGLVESARLVEVAPWLSLEVRPPAWALVAAYYAALIAVLSRRARRPARAILATLIAVMVLGPDAATRAPVGPPSLALRVVVLDVGQGDATIVSLPGGRALLVDAGGLAMFGSGGAIPAGAPPAFDIGERVVRPALAALGVDGLEGLIVTHGDPDHLLGAPAVVQRTRVRSVWEGVPVPAHAGLRALASLAVSRGATWRTVQAGDRERFGEVEVRVLHPPPPDWERQRVRNEDSVVLELRIGEVSVILPGDIGAEGERAVLPRIEPGRLVVLKAPHHGSATSSTTPLLRALRPAAVIFSCGRDNRFGHPHPAVVARYAGLGTEIFRTDRDGAVFVETDGTKVEVRGWVGRRVVLRR